LPKLEEPVRLSAIGALPKTLAARTKRIYDRLSPVYVASAMLFHSRAHRLALEASGLRDGMNVLEVATGSGEMFQRLVRRNASGATVGVDLSPNMAARTQRAVRRQFPKALTDCQAVDARQMPFRNESFDAIFCCYLLELLAAEDIARAIEEFRRILRRRGRLILVLIGQNTPAFNAVYKVAGSLVPAFWGRQIERRVPELIEAAQFEIVHDRTIRQIYYPSRILVVRK
jgi:ubiquinone/menaquinone biosynthesis C-methylase UbiE